jgi:hypothetical protein
LQTNDLGSKDRPSLALTPRVSVLNDNVFPLHVAKLTQTPLESIDPALGGRNRAANQHAYPKNFLRLLRLGEIKRIEKQQNRD